MLKLIKPKKFNVFCFTAILALLMVNSANNLFYADSGSSILPGNSDPSKVGNNQKYNPDRIMIQAVSLKEAKKIAVEYDLKVVKDYKALSKDRGKWYGAFERKKNNTTEVDEIIWVLQSTPGIIYAGLDYEVSIGLTPNDPRLSQLWGLHNTGQTGGTIDADINAPEAWNFSTGSSSVIIAVIDTGVDYNHPDLSPNMWHNPREIPDNSFDDDGNGYRDDIYGIDTRNNDSDPYDDNYHGHGTHCAGTIGAKGNDGYGVVGVNWNVKIMALKFISSGGYGSTSDAVECMNYLIDMKRRGENIVASSNSWGGGGFDPNLRDAIYTAGNLGVLFVAAAGNNSSDNDSNPFYPASYVSNYVIAVAATDHNDQLASFSNWGARTVDLGAPGVSIVSCSQWGGFRTLSGTSMAAPHVSGAVGLLASFSPNDTAIERKHRIVNYVDRIPDLSGGCVSGGRLNLYNSIVGPSFAAAEFSSRKQGDLTREFTDESTAKFCIITVWHWDFGDGSTSSQQNPTHTYASSGWYNVTMTVTSNTGVSDSNTKRLWIGPNLIPIPNFTFSTLSGLNIDFTDQSTDQNGFISQWYWEFGDGETSTIQNLSHQYQSYGTYDVTLTVTDNEGDSASITREVKVKKPFFVYAGSVQSPFSDALGWNVGQRYFPMDVNGDGKGDLVMRYANGVFETWLSNGTIFYYAGSVQSPFNDAEGWNVGQRYFPMDVNGDGKGDLVMRYANGVFETWLSNGTIFYSAGSVQSPFNDAEGWNVGQRYFPMDVNGDGRGDIVARDWAGGFHTWLSSLTPTSLLSVTSPNGGENWQLGSTHNITWHANGLGGDMTIDLYKGGVFNSNIGVTNANSGSYLWDIPTDLTGGNDYQVRVYRGAAEDYSDSYFSVIPESLLMAAPDFNGDGRADVIWRYDAPEGYNAVWLMGTVGGTSTAAAAYPNKITPASLLAKMNFDTREGIFQKNVWESVETFWTGTVKDGFAGQTHWNYNASFAPGPFAVDNKANQNISRVMASSVSDPRDDPQCVELPVVADQNWKLAGTGDFNRDGKVDIVWSNVDNAHNCVWYMDGTTIAGYGQLPDGSTTDWVLAGVGDFDQDGNPDLIWRNEVDGRNGIWYMDGAELSSVGWLTSVEDQNWKLHGTGDFNGDGKTDLIWTDISDGRNCTWYMDGVTLAGVEFLTIVTDTDWKIVN